MSINLEDPVVATGLEKVNPQPNSQEGQYQRNVLTTGHLHSPPMLVRSYLKSCMLGFSQTSKLGSEKEQELQIKPSTFAKLYRKQGNFRNTSICFIDYTKAFVYVDHDKL